MNMLQKIIQFILSFFKKPMGVLPTASDGSDEAYTPTIILTGNSWLPYLTQPFESQYTGFDQLNCVSKSGLHCVEAILNYFYRNNLFPDNADFKKLIETYGFLNPQGFIDLSERFTAKMAGTTPQGLAMDKFWQSINRDGFVPASQWQEPDGVSSWAEYYKEIPQNVIDQGKAIAKVFQWTWKVVENDNWNAPNLNKLQEALKHSPIHFATASCPRDSLGIQQWCGKKVYQHARLLYSIDNERQQILDQYSPFLTISESEYPLGCVIVAALKLI